jgi:menaquinone-9 beta-reductase
VYDVLVVGGRCAGASLAILLARQGAKVAMCEADRLGTDQLLSTHTIHPAGMDVLDELGVGGAVRAGSPPMRQVRFDVDGSVLDVQLPPGRHECCPRRYRLDRLLQAAAVAAGVDTYEQARVTDLLRTGDRVVGVRVRQGSGDRQIPATLVVGADGRHSTVARLAGADEYLAYEWPRGMYWAYWQPPARWKSPDYPYDMLLRMIGPARRLIFTTDEGQLLLGTVPELHLARAWRHDHASAYLADLRSDPVLQPLVEGGTRTSRVIGTVSERFFFRRAAGYGWALVGDAGHHKDPLVGWGISEALVQAKHLAAAIAEGGDAALQRYWHQRDIDALPRYVLARERGECGAISPLVPLILSKAPSAPWLPHTLAREIEYDANPYELLPMGHVVRWVLGAAIRGRPALLRHFFAQGRRVRRVRREVAAARERLMAVPVG